MTFCNDSKVYFISTTKEQNTIDIEFDCKVSLVHGKWSFMDFSMFSHVVWKV